MIDIVSLIASAVTISALLVEGAKRFHGVLKASKELNDIQVGGESSMKESGPVPTHQCTRTKSNS